MDSKNLNPTQLNSGLGQTYPMGLTYIDGSNYILDQLQTKQTSSNRYNFRK